jgi:hypothetical protein
MSLPKELWRDHETCRQLAQRTMGHPGLVMFGLAVFRDLMRSHTKPTFGSPLCAPHQQETLRTQMEFGAEHAPG